MMSWVGAWILSVAAIARLLGKRGIVVSIGDVLASIRGRKEKRRKGSEEIGLWCLRELRFASFNGSFVLCFRAMSDIVVLRCCILEY